MSAFDWPFESRPIMFRTKQRVDWPVSNGTAYMVRKLVLVSMLKAMSTLDSGSSTALLPLRLFTSRNLQLSTLLRNGFPDQGRNIDAVCDFLIIGSVLATCLRFLSKKPSGSDFWGDNWFALATLAKNPLATPFVQNLESSKFWKRCVSTLQPAAIVENALTYTGRCKVT